MKPCIKTVEKMFSTLNVDITDVDKCADHIEAIFDVTEIKAYELAQQLKENAKMSEFTMTGFHHVSKNGVIAFWQYLEQQGSLDLLYDMKPATKVNELMLSEDFDLDAHIKTNYPREDYDTILIEINDEMLDAITALEFCFATNQTQISFNGRSFENLDCIPSTDVWSPNYYLNCRSFNNIDDLGEYCMEATYTGVVTVLIKAYTNKTVNQEFQFIIGGAQDFNTLCAMIKTMEASDCDYTKFEFTIA